MLTLAMMLSMFPTFASPAYAASMDLFLMDSADGVAFDVSDVEAKPGESVLVPIYLTNNPGFSAATFRFTLGEGLEWDYDPDLYGSNRATWPFVDSNEVMAVSGRPMGPALTENMIQLTYINMDGENVYNDGLLVSLKVKVSEGATGDIPINMVIVVFVNEMEFPVPYTVSPGTVSVAGAGGTDGVIFDVSDIEAKPGDKFLVPVYLTNNP
jgi:hypothetical protein